MFVSSVCHSDTYVISSEHLYMFGVESEAESGGAVQGAETDKSH